MPRQYGVSDMMHELFESQVDRNPEAIALVGEDGYLTYRELEGRANQVAHALRALGVGPEVCVGLCTGRNLEMIVGLLGILKAGGAYVPLDPAYPRQRLSLMLEEIQAPVVLTRGSVQAALPKSHARVLQVDSDPQLSLHPMTRPSRLAAPENLAYVLYTSGSTGRPKGVQIEHRNVINLAMALAPVLDLSSDSRVLQYASISFDMSLADLLMAWISGGSLHLLTVEARLPGPALVDLLDKQQITHVMMPPSVLTTLPDARLPALRLLMTGGEICPESIVDRWSPGRRFINAYGPTEATFCATLIECTEGSGPPPIGKPVNGYSLYLLDN